MLDSAQGNPTEEVGNWTIIYDQGIVVELPGKHKAKYTANFRYSLKPEIQPSQFDGLKCGSYEAFTSTCDETMVGVKFNEDKMLQCWVGYQTAPLTEQKPQQTDLVSPLILAQTGAEDNAEVPLNLAQAKTETMGRLGSFSDMPEEERILLA